MCWKKNTRRYYQLNSESELQTIILDYLNRQSDVFAWRNNSVGVYDEKKKIYRRKGVFSINGVSDILGVLYPSGIFLAVEVKKPYSTLSAVSPEQLSFIAKVRKMGGYAIWVSSLKEVEDFINGIRLDQQKRIGT